MFFKFCRQGGNPKIPRKIHFQWLIWEMIDCLEVFARPFQVIQTVQRDIYYWKLCWYKIPFSLPIILYWLKKKGQVLWTWRKTTKKYHFRSSDLMCISRKHADYNGKKLIWLLISVGKSKIWPKTGSSFAGKLKCFFVPCTEYFGGYFILFLFISVGPIIQLSTSPGIRLWSDMSSMKSWGILHRKSFLAKSHIFDCNGVGYWWFWLEGFINASNSILLGLDFVPCY